MNMCLHLQRVAEVVEDEEEESREEDVVHPQNTEKVSR